MKYQSDPRRGGQAAVREFTAILPRVASALYFRDPIGNVSTSGVRRLRDKLEVRLQPRYPLFGGWQVRAAEGSQAFKTYLPPSCGLLRMWQALAITYQSWALCHPVCTLAVGSHTAQARAQSALWYAQTQPCYFPLCKSIQQRATVTTHFNASGSPELDVDVGEWLLRGMLRAWQLCELLCSLDMLAQSGPATLPCV